MLFQTLLGGCFLSFPSCHCCTLKGDGIGSSQYSVCLVLLLSREWQQIWNSNGAHKTPTRKKAGGQKRPSLVHPTTRRRKLCHKIQSMTDVRFIPSVIEDWGSFFQRGGSMKSRGYSCQKPWLRQLEIKLGRVPPTYVLSFSPVNYWLNRTTPLLVIHFKPFVTLLVVFSVGRWLVSASAFYSNLFDG